MIDDKTLKILCDKVEETLDESWEDIKQTLGFNGSKDTLRKSWSAAPYGGYYVYQYLKDKQLNSSTNDEIERIKKAQEEEYKERCRLQDQRREYNKILREQARFEHLTDLMLDKMESLPYKELDISDIRFNTEGKSATLLLSDWHKGLVIDNIFNKYDNTICEQRVANLTSKTLAYCKQHGVNKLYMLLGGDFISGIIQVTARINQEEDVIEQTLDVAEILCQMIECFVTKGIQVEVVSTFGNHARVIADKKQSLNRENFERLIPKYIKKRCPYVVVRDSEGEDFIEFKVDGQNCVLAHGDADSPLNALGNFVRLLGYVPNRIYLGHTHSLKDYDDCDTEIIVNGSLCGSDDYAIKLRKNTKPHQILQIFDNDVCHYKIMV